MVLHYIICLNLGCYNNYTFFLKYKSGFNVVGQLKQLNLSVFFFFNKLFQFIKIISWLQKLLGICCAGFMVIWFCFIISFEGHKSNIHASAQLNQCSTYKLTSHHLIILSHINVRVRKNYVKTVMINGINFTLRIKRKTFKTKN